MLLELWCPVPPFSSWRAWQVASDLRHAEGGGKSEAERRRQQSAVLSAVFETYFRILKTTHEAASGPALKTRCAAQLFLLRIPPLTLP